MWLIPTQVIERTGVQSLILSEVELPSISITDLDQIAQNRIPKALSLSTLGAQTVNTIPFLNDIAAHFGIRDVFNYKVPKLIRNIYVDGYAGITWLFNKTLKTTLPNANETFVLQYANSFKKQRGRKSKERFELATKFTSMTDSEWLSSYRETRANWAERSKKQKGATNASAKKRFSAQPLVSTANARGLFWDFQPMRPNPSLFAPSSTYKGVSLFSTPILKAVASVGRTDLESTAIAANPRFIECVMGLPIGWTSPLHKQIWLMSTYPTTHTIVEDVPIDQQRKPHNWLTPTVQSAKSGRTLEWLTKKQERFADYQSRKKSGTLAEGEKPPMGLQKSIQINIAEEEVLTLGSPRKRQRS